MENVNYFFGENTYGDKVKVATNGVDWFSKIYKYNGYAMTWTKWEKLDDEDKPEIYLNGFDEPVIKWGWNELKGFYNNRIRLPKN